MHSIIPFGAAKVSLATALILMLAFHSPVFAEEPAELDHCIALPNQDLDFGAITEDTLRDWIPTLRYAINPDQLSVQNRLYPNPALRQRFVPTNRGSARVLAVADVAPRRTYILEQSIFIEPGFDWGGISESGKIGFGLGGGSLPSGGDLGHDGFTVRLAWDGNHDGTARLGAYIYSADRYQNLPYGDIYNVHDFNIPIGEWFDLTLVVTANSALNKADGSLAIFVNDEVRLWQGGFLWQSAGDQPMVDTLLYSSFHGGSSTNWTPDRTSFAQFSDVCFSYY